ncbi:MAG: glutamate ligase domain-containing protein, partial [Candidatus Krumholzibacteriia bacterium]
EHCRRRKTPLRLLPADAARVLDLDLWAGMQFELRLDEPRRLWTRLLGVHHARNAGLAAVAVADLLAGQSPALRVDLAAAVARAFLPGRFQVLPPCGSDPTIILDVAHNPESLRATLEVAEQVLGDARPVVVLGMLRDKRLDGVAGRLARWAQRLVLTAPQVQRAWELQRACEQLSADAGTTPVSTAPNIAEALESAFATAPAAVLVLGSHYLVGEALPVLAHRRGLPDEALLAALPLEEATRAAG